MIGPIIILILIIMIFNSFGSNKQKKEIKKQPDYTDIKRVCPYCNGLGSIPTCSYCFSRASEEPSSEHHDGDMYCAECDKKGYKYRIDPDFCECCRGTGKVTEDELYNYHTG